MNSQRGETHRKTVCHRVGDQRYKRRVTAGSSETKNAATTCVDVGMAAGETENPLKAFRTGEGVRACAEVVASADPLCSRWLGGSG